MTETMIERLKVCQGCEHYRLGTAAPSRCEQMPGVAAEFRAELERDDGLCPLGKWTGGGDAPARSPATTPHGGA